MFGLISFALAQPVPTHKLPESIFVYQEEPVPRGTGDRGGEEPGRPKTDLPPQPQEPLEPNDPG